MTVFRLPVSDEDGTRGVECFPNRTGPAEVGDPAGGVSTEPALGPAGVSAPRDHGGILTANFGSTPRRRFSPDLELVTTPRQCLPQCRGWSRLRLLWGRARTLRERLDVRVDPRHLSDVPLSSTEDRLFFDPADCGVEEGMSGASSKQTI